MSFLRRLWRCYVAGSYIIRSYKQYRDEDIRRAVELVHQGASIREAKAATGVPNATLCRNLEKCKRHEGPCKGAALRPFFLPDALQNT